MREDIDDKDCDTRSNELNMQLKRVVKNTPYPLMVHADDGEILMISDTWRKMSGYGLEDLPTIDAWAEKAYGEKAQEILDFVKKFYGARAERSYHGEREIITKWGDRRVCEVRSVKIGRLPDGRNMVLTMAHDVTEQKELERQRDDFLAMVTHDLKSPLTAIMGYSELLLYHEKADPDIKEMVGIILQNGNRMLAMVEDFLTIARIKAGSLLLAEREEDAGEVLDGVYKEFLAVAEKKNIRLTLEKGPLTKTLLDRRQMERAVSNLVQNAINYTKEGGSVTVRGESREGRELVISVADTGIGISPDDVERIFDRYYRSGDASVTKGAGLGLAIVKAVAEAHGGKVEVESSEGKGSMFRIIIPVREALSQAA